MDRARKPATDACVSESGASTSENWDTSRRTVTEDFTNSESSDTTGIPSDTSRAAISDPSWFPRTRMATSPNFPPASTTLRTEATISSISAS